jgi:Skp family chaperone for outer membrane proteins
MSIRAVTVGSLVCIVALFATFESGRAAPESPAAPMKIAVVSIRNVFNTSKRHAQYRAQVLSNQSRAKAQLEDLAKDIEAEEAGLKALVPGTADYMKQLQTVLDKRSRLDSQQEYLKQQRSLEDKTWMEALYRESLKITKEVAKDKGVTLVLERTEPEFPVTPDELMMTFSTHKVLYAENCVDLTEEVTTRVDANPTVKP